MHRRFPNALVARLLLGGFLFFAVAPMLLANPSFPRGPGFYYNPFKLAFALLSFWGWVKLVSWVDEDANCCRLAASRWNSILFAASVFAFLVAWTLAWFWFSAFFFWVTVLGSTGLYIYYRNKEMQESDRLLTPRHLRELWAKYGKGLSRKKAGGDDVQLQKIPVRFMSRKTTGEEEVDERRVEKVQQSRGYKAAQEMVWEAINKRATDIHMEPTEDQMAVRLRVDGIMTNVVPFSRVMGEAVINIFKVLCNLDITERRKPQDGSFSAQVGSGGDGEWTYRLIDFRVATAGSVVGEKLVMRLLDASQQLTDLTQIGMPEPMREQILELVTKPHGLFLVCGPTGSGKSTTLHAALHLIDRFTLNVITVENPVEFRIPNVTQIEINPKAGKTFATELRSILRQDPDVIMVGEIRDKETAEIACQAAQTGHMVFSTVHANDTVTAIGRLIDLGVQPFMISTALTAVLGQRLVRRLCKDCRVRFKPSADTLKKLGASPDLVRYLYRPPDPAEKPHKDDEDEEVEETCENCGGAGYLRRTGVFELLVVSDSVRDQIRANPDLNAIRQDLTKAGMLTLFQDGARLVVDGETSVQELMRVAK